MNLHKTTQQYLQRRRGAPLRETLRNHAINRRISDLFPIFPKKWFAFSFEIDITLETILLLPLSMTPYSVSPVGLDTGNRYHVKQGTGPSVATLKGARHA